MADFMTNKPLQLQGSHFRRLYNYTMGMTSIKKPQNPNMSSVTVIKRDGRVKVGLFERNKIALRLVSPSQLWDVGTISVPHEHVGVI